MAPPNLRTDMTIAQLPATPNVGNLLGKNSLYVDPDFGTQVVRLTDGSSGSGNFSSMQTNGDPSGYPLWNTNDTLLMSRNNQGVAFVFQFNPATMQGTQLGTAYPYKLTGATCFSKVNPGVLYNAPESGSILNAITYALMGGVWTYVSTTLVVDFAAILPGGFNVDWQSDLTIASGDALFSMSFSQGTQDTGFNCCLYKPGSGLRMVNTQTLAVTGAWGATGTATLVNTNFSSFLLHDVGTTPNVLYTTLSPVTPAHSGNSIGTIVWVNETLTMTQTGESGHHGLGYVNVYSGGAGQGQYVEIPLANPTTKSPIIPTQAGPPGLPKYQSPPQTYTGDQHSGFAPPTPGDAALLAISNGPPNVFPFTACWMGEVRLLDVTGSISGAEGTVYRAAHTFNSGKSQSYIVQSAQIAPSQTGNFVAFTSDFGGAGTIGPLGSTSGANTGTIGVDARGDMFIIQIPYASLAPTITSANATTFTQNVFGSFTVNTTGDPTPAISESGSLPSGVTFVDNGNGTATLSGTPTASGTFALTITAANGISPNATQPFTLTVSATAPGIGPVITSASSATFSVGFFGSFTVNATGTPAPTITQGGALPAGVTFVNNGNGTGTLSGTPQTAGTYRFDFLATNGILPNAVQFFTLTVVRPIPAGTVTGTFQFANGKPIANGSYQWKLSFDSVELSLACMVPTIVNGSLDSNGNLNTTLVFNSVLQTSLGMNTTYQLTVRDFGGRQVWNENYYLTGTAVNLNLIPPGGGVS